MVPVSVPFFWMYRVSFFDILCAWTKKHQKIRILVTLTSTILKALLVTHASVSSLDGLIILAPHCCYSVIVFNYKEWGYKYLYLKRSLLLILIRKKYVTILRQFLLYFQSIWSDMLPVLQNVSNQQMNTFEVSLRFWPALPWYN